MSKIMGIRYYQGYLQITQLTFTYSMSTIETLERSEICSKLPIKTPERRQWRRSGGFIVNSKHISHIFLVFLILNLNKQVLAGKVTPDIDFAGEAGVQSDVPVLEILCGWWKSTNNHKKLWMWILNVLFLELILYIVFSRNWCIWSYSATCLCSKLLLFVY